MTTRKVAVLGAGPTGLSTAWFLAREAGLSAEIHVFEKEPRPGGHHQSVSFGPHVFDTGCFAYWQSGDSRLSLPWLVPEVFEPIHNFTHKVLLAGEIHPFPFPPRLMVSRLTPGERLRFGPELAFRAVWRTQTSDRRRDLESWLRRRLGSPLYRASELPCYLYKLMGLPPAEIHRDLGIKRLVNIEEQTRAVALVKRLLGMAPWRRDGAVDGASDRSDDGPVFMYPRSGGAGAIAEQMVQRLEEREVSFHLESPAVEVAPGTRGVSVAWDSGGHVERGDFDAVVSTLPISTLARLCPQGPDDFELRYRRLWMVFLTVDMPNALGDAAILYSFDRHARWKRITAYSEFRPTGESHRATALGIEIPLDEGEDLGSPREHAAAAVAQISADSGLFSPEHVTYMGCKLLVHAYPVLDLEYDRKAATFQRSLAPHPIVSVGRQGAFDYCFTPECVAYGREAADRVSERLG